MSFHFGRFLLFLLFFFILRFSFLEAFANEIRNKNKGTRGTDVRMWIFVPAHQLNIEKGPDSGHENFANHGVDLLRRSHVLG
jgi:hypothetical protein